jgi:hypothetical protein
MPLDLHVHTTASDGVLSPSDVVRAAIATGLSAIAITDHDTVDGVDEALAASAGTALTVVPGVELSVDEENGIGAHVLGLLIDHTDPRLAVALEALRLERDARARRMVALLAEAGHPIDFETVRAIAGHGSIGRVHIARALVQAGSVATIPEAFDVFIGSNAPFYVRKRTLDPGPAIEAIHGAGGVAVLAHPGINGEGALPALLAAGLDGIEAFHSEHTAVQSARFAALAASHALLVTGGSDFHGHDAHAAPLGGGACPEDALDALRLRAARYRA